HRRRAASAERAAEALRRADEGDARDAVPLPRAAGAAGREAPRPQALPSRIRLPLASRPLRRGRRGDRGVLDRGAGDDARGAAQGVRAEAPPPAPPPLTRAPGQRRRRSLTADRKSTRLN